jgi:bis(5'-nucleosyl)-tetraphosphatase (symmetrical)
MAVYLIGDVQGCDSALQGLLETIDFSPSRDTLYLLGDLVNRGPSSLAVLRRLMALGDCARSILGNHDLHLLAVANGIRPLHRSDTVQDILSAPDRTALLDWLRQQPLVRLEFGFLMVHAGVLPAWTATKTVALANEVSAVLQSPDYPEFLRQMYGNEPQAWSEDLQGFDRLRVIVNALTRLRFCSAQGEMEFATKEGAGQAPAGYMPWFDVPGRQSASTPTACGHWSTLGLVQRNNLLGLDTGCVWGGCLSAWHMPEHFDKYPDLCQGQVLQVHCEQAQKPGASPAQSQ